ncbi:MULTISPECIES: MarR family transcriptional regulator [Citrobacter]|uniref:MarR family transcriptional regulator n=1 Tax=Citrobacter TaxID=544 RepID=UPI00163B1D6D|nr:MULTISPECIES: MarR family transcriptional regulator [Citrobacter]MDM2872280.1 MarR family transcriptional regulator [Citrobacter sp. Cpo069]QXR23578.1 MarR family transcriptional regulator [Citrobacter freundii]
MITETELNVLKVMAEKDIDWNWIALDSALYTRGVSGFGNVANIVTNLVNNGLVDIVNNEDKSRQRYRVSEYGFNFLKNQSEHGWEVT